VQHCARGEHVVAAPLGVDVGRTVSHARLPRQMHHGISASQHLDHCVVRGAELGDEMAPAIVAGGSPIDTDDIGPSGTQRVDETAPDEPSGARDDDHDRNCRCSQQPL